jgi:hypothetical protein
MSLTRIKEFVRLCSFHDLNRAAAVDARPTSVDPAVVRNRGYIIMCVRNRDLITM